MWLTLDSGLKVRADAIECSYTYGGLLEGRPNEEVNARILKYLQTKLGKIWGGRKNHLLPPQIDRSDPEHPLLPPAMMIAWLDSVEHMEGGIHGRIRLSQLVVGWFTRSFSDRPLIDILQQELHALPWHELAEEYEP